MGCLQSQADGGKGDFAPFGDVVMTEKPPPNVNEKLEHTVNDESHREEGARCSQRVLMYQSKNNQGAPPVDTENNQQSQDLPQYSTQPKDFNSSEKGIPMLSKVDDLHRRPSPKVLMCQCNKKLGVSLVLEHRVQSQDFLEYQMKTQYAGLTISKPFALEQRLYLKDSPQYQTQSEDSSTEIASSAPERRWKPMSSRQNLTQSEAFVIEIPPVILEQKLLPKTVPENVTRPEDLGLREKDSTVFKRVDVWDSIFECEVKFLERAACNLVDYSSELIDEELEHCIDDYIEETYGEGFSTVQQKLHFVRNVLWLFRAYLSPLGDGVPNRAGNTLYTTRKISASELKIWWEDYVEEMSRRYEAMLKNGGIKELVNLFFRHYLCPAEIKTQLRPAIMEKINTLFKKEISNVKENVLSVFNSNICPSAGKEDQQDFLAGYIPRSFLVIMLNILNGTIMFVRQYPAIVKLLKELEEKWHSYAEYSHHHDHHDHHWDHGSVSHYHHDHFSPSHHHRRRSSTFDHASIVDWEHHDRFDTRRDSHISNCWKPLISRRESHLSGAWKPMRLASRRLSHLNQGKQPRRESQLFSASKPIGYIGRERDYNAKRSHVTHFPHDGNPLSVQKLTISTPIHTRAVSMDTGANAVSQHLGVVQNPPKSILKVKPGGIRSMNVKFDDTCLTTTLDHQTSTLPGGISRDDHMMQLLRSLSTLHPKKPVLRYAWTVAEKSCRASDSAFSKKENLLGTQKRCSKPSESMGEDESDDSSATPPSSLMDETLDLWPSISQQKSGPESDHACKVQSNSSP